MTVLQQLVFEMEAPYAGRPYHVSGHALFNAIASQVGDRARRSLHVSHGVFVPAEYGAFPDRHSQDGYGGVLGGSLPAVESYSDLFLFRDAAQRWLLDSRPRDAHNVHPIQSHAGRVVFDPGVKFGRPAHVRNSKRTVNWYVHCYVHSDDGRAVLPLSRSCLDGVRVGGARNYGFGALSLADSQLVDLAAVSFAELRGHDAYTVDLVTPYVLQSDVPGADRQSVPWWWEPTAPAVPVEESDADRGTSRLRRRAERVVHDGETYELATVDHGQLVKYAGTDPVGTARNGVTRVGTHSRYGYGELRVRPAPADRVPERGDATRTEGGA